MHKEQETPSTAIKGERQMLLEAQQKGLGAKLWIYTRLSGPGWIASAITLGGGSLASSLYLGVLGGYSLLWVQPFAMIMGVIMLGAIGYVTLSTGERPFRGINEHVSPVLGWGWALAVAAANVIWCMPQHSLAYGVLSQNLLPSQLGEGSALANWAAAQFSDLPWLAANFDALLVSLTILVFATVITWSYDRGGWGIRLYEWVLKIMVAMIVLCFFGVVMRLTFSSAALDWGAVLAGFVPDLTQFFKPADTYGPLLDAVGLPGSAAREYWSEQIVTSQRDVLISAAATAVGINMTLMFPYTMLRRGWTKEYRGLSIYDLCTGMFVPYVLATSCVVIAAASRFHTEVAFGFDVATENDQVVAVHEPDLESAEFKERPLRQQKRIQENLAGYNKLLAARDLKLDSPASMAERQLAATLITRDAMDLSQSLEPLTGAVVAHWVFGLGVLAMVLSTISILMLISGFVFAEMMNFPAGGKMHKAGTMVAGIGGALWPLFWTGQSKFYLAVVTSVFGFMLLPFAYVTFVLLLNSRSLLKDQMPTGGKRLLWNALAGISALVATVAAAYMIWVKAEYIGVFAVVLYIVLAVMVAVNQYNERRRRSRDERA